eukprot:3147589-Prymnesium_polylepis.1
MHGGWPYGVLAAEEKVRPSYVPAGSHTVQLEVSTFHFPQKASCGFTPHSLTWGTIHAGLATEVQDDEGSADEYQRRVADTFAF